VTADADAATTADALPAPDRRETVDDLVAAWEAFAGLIEPLEAADWDRATRCTGWQVRHVAGHVAGMTVDAAEGRPTTDPDRQAATFGELPPGDVAQHLRTAAGQLGPVLRSVDDRQWAAPFGDRFPSLGEAVQTLLHDVHVHGDDIAAALGRAPWTGPGLQAAVHTVATRLLRRGWSGPTVIVDGHPVLPAPPGSDPPDSAPPGQPHVVRTNAYDFVLAATGRLSPTALDPTLDAAIDIYAAP
jgi:uncharacterized protein (TIGR03083 family)